MASSGNGFQGGYNVDRSPSGIGSGDAVDTSAIDPASNSFLSGPDMKKHEDLKQMLDSNKDSLKLEAMKRIIGMVAKGKDASDLFPAVVKNVVCKNLEVKKLVYVYLTRYAEEQQDLALLSISTFQRALKDPNQLIRASALRVLSSIRVGVIIPIMMLAIKDGCSDMSPYVRKTAAHAIPKLYSLDPEQKDELISVIEKLLGDKTTLVAGSAIAAFEEVCPERIDLVHKNYRKLCGLLMDVDEWGQVSIINMLTRYCRTQFLDPSGHVKSDQDMTDPKNFYEDKESSASEAEGAEEKPVYTMDADHRTLLRACKPLLNSRNAAVVLGVAQLYYHCAPPSEVSLVTKALIRLLRGHKEVQYLVLCNISSITAERRGLFEPYLKSFYVRSSDPLQVKLLKLEILTNIGSESSISTVLREFQTYVKSSDAEFVAATIQGIGRCASSIPEVTEACLNGLVRLLSNRNEAVVAESVVVIKKLLQMQPTEHKDIIAHLATLVDKITVPAARASILWLLGEYCDRVPKIAPDVLRKTAKTFVQEEDIVKLQVLNLAAKLCLMNARQTRLLCQYVLQLAKYDMNYDIRDRARFLKALLFPAEGAAGAQLARYAKKILLSSKPAPLLTSKFQDRETYQLATLTHVLNAPATGYKPLPEWPEVAPDPSVRAVEPPPVWTDTSSSTATTPKKRTAFYSDEESSSGSETEDSESDSEESEGSGSGSEESEESETDSSEEDSVTDSSEDEPVKPPVKASVKVAATSKPAPAQESSGSESDSEESESEESSSDSEPAPPPPPQPKTKKSKKPSKAADGAASQPPKALENLLDLDFGPSNESVGTMPLQASAALMPQTGVAPAQAAPQAQSNLVLGVSPGQVPLKTHELLNRMTGKGLQVLYRFPRTVSVFEPRMVTCELTFSNTGDAEITDIKIGEKKLQKNMSMQDFPPIATLAPTNQTKTTVGIDFGDTTQPASFELLTAQGRFSVSVSAPVGELLQPHTMTEKDFVSQRGKLTGMTETTGSVQLSEAVVKDTKALVTRVYQAANLSQAPGSDEELLFCGRTAATQTLCLLTLKSSENGRCNIRVNCEKMVVCSMLLKELKASLTA